MLMATYEFAKSQSAKEFCDEIEKVLVIEGKKTTTEAERLIKQFWSGRSDIEEDQLLYRELPYYYAMCILHHPILGDNYPFWWKNPEFWPPPSRWNTWRQVMLPSESKS